MIREYISDSINMARHIAYLCSHHNFEYNNTKIQKLLYICYGVFLATQNKRLVDEQPEAWPYGPVFPKVFKYINTCKEDYQKQLKFPDNNIENELNNIIKCFGCYPAGKLSAWSHIENSPWDKVIDKNNPEWELGIVIPDEIIKAYFKEKVIRNARAQ